MINAWIRSFSIRFRMVGAILTVLALLALVSGVGLWGMGRLHRVSDGFMAGTHARTMDAVALERQLGNIRRHEKDLVIHLDSAEAAARHQALWNTAVQQATQMAQRLGQGSADAGATAAAAVAGALADYAAKAAPVLTQAAAGGFATAALADRALEPAKTPIHATEAEVGKLLTHLKAQQEAAAAELAGASSLAHLLFAAAALVSALVVVPLTLANMASICAPVAQARAVAERIATGELSQEVQITGNDEISALLRSLAGMQHALQSLVNEVRQSASSVQLASSEVAAGNSDLSSRTEQTASSLQQTASSMQQLTVNVRSGADAAATANQLASSASDVARRGGEVVSQVVSTMDGIQTASRRIGDIIGTIDG
ncbi:HAMP domain-containing protein, partial [Azohydromonas lata]|uniref:HAMP domain-containing protein n=1 Tax=Azohydromonas lata TaxID=45677 RepID=UPI00082B699C